MYPRIIMIINIMMIMKNHFLMVNELAIPTGADEVWRLPQLGWSCLAQHPQSLRTRLGPKPDGARDPEQPRDPAKPRCTLGQVDISVFLRNMLQYTAINIMNHIHLILKMVEWLEE